MDSGKRTIYLRRIIKSFQLEIFLKIILINRHIKKAAEKNGRDVVITARTLKTIE